MKKSTYVERLVFGTSFNREPFHLSEVIEKGDDFSFILGDRTGYIESILVDLTREKVELIRSNPNGVFLVTGVVLNKEGADICKQVRVKEIELAAKNQYLISEVFGGISEENKKLHMSKILEEKEKYVKDPELKALVDALLTDENLEKLSVCPVTLSEYGTYAGAALVATDLVLGLAVQSACAPMRRGNGFNLQPTDWGLLISAALLTQIGRIEYFNTDNPFEKSRRGVIMNYFPLLQDMIMRTIHENGICIDGMKLSSLLNALQVTLSRSDTACASREAVILRHAYSFFKDVDMYDFGAASADFEGAEKPYVYSEKGNFYYLAPAVLGGE